MADKVEGETIFTVKSTDGQDIMDALHAALAKHPHLEVLFDCGDQRITRLSLQEYESESGPVQYLELETDFVFGDDDDLPEEDDGRDDQEEPSPT